MSDFVQTPVCSFYLQSLSQCCCTTLTNSWLFISSPNVDFQHNTYLQTEKFWLPLFLMEGLALLPGAMRHLDYCDNSRPACFIWCNHTECLQVDYQSRRAEDRRLVTVGLYDMEMYKLKMNAFCSLVISISIKGHITTGSLVNCCSHRPLS